MEGVILAFVAYFMIGTFFLMMFITDYLHLEMTSKKTGKKLENVDVFIMSLCLYWPFLVFLLLKGGKKDEN